MGTTSCKTTGLTSCKTTGYTSCKTTGYTSCKTIGFYCVKPKKERHTSRHNALTIKDLYTKHYGKLNAVRILFAMRYIVGTGTPYNSER